MQRSSWQAAPDIDVDAALRRKAALSNPDVPAYSTLDMRVAWSPRPGLELSVSGQNLSGPGHGEFTAIGTRSQIGRTLLLNLSSRF